MSDSSGLFPLSEQPSSVQLTVSAMVILVAGLLSLTLFLLAGSLFTSNGMKDIIDVSLGEAITGSGVIFKYLQAVQGISLFIIPSLIISFMMTKGNGDWLLTRYLPAGLLMVLVVCIAVLLFPVTSISGVFNSKMELPLWLSKIEDWMRVKEDLAANYTDILLEAATFPQLLLNLFVIALLPAIGEEMLFRGVLQQIFQKMFRSGHWAVWITAILFSSIHLQFFGFLPRLILGLVFGYLFYWGRSLWFPITAHFINNAIPVIFSYLSIWDQSETASPEITGTQVLVSLLSATTIVIILLYFRDRYRISKPATGNEPCDLAI